MEPSTSIDAIPHVFAQPVAGLVPGVLLHRSRHADTVRATWHGLDVVAKRVREDIADEDERQRAGQGILREGLLLSLMAQGGGGPKRRRRRRRSPAKAVA